MWERGDERRDESEDGSGYGEKAGDYVRGNYCRRLMDVGVKKTFVFKSADVEMIRDHFQIV